MADPTTQQLQQAAAQAAQANNIPVPVFMSLIQNESSWRPHVVSSQGAIGPGQLLPGTARDLAVNPNDPIANINGTARYFRQKLDKWGNLDDAVRAFHGGDDTSGWGPLGEQEVARVAATAPHYANFGPQPAQQQPSAPTAPADPYETALIHASNGRNAPSASPAQAPPQSSDPFEAALINASNGRHGSVAPVSVGGSAGMAGLPGHAGDRLGNQTGPGGAGIPVDLAGNQGAGLQAGAGGNFGGAARGTGAGLPQDNGFQQDTSLSRANGLVDSALSGLSAHLIHPLTAGINSILPVDRLSGEDVHSVWDGSSLGDAFKHNMGIETGNYQQFQQAHPLASGLAELGGGIASPLNKIGMPVKGAGLVANGVRLALGGGVYGGVSSLADNGDPGDAAKSAAIGAVAAPALGAVIAPVAKGASALAAAVRNAVSKTPGLDFAPAAFRRTIQSMIESGSSVGDVVKAAADAGHPVTPESVQKYVDYRTAGGKNPAGFAPPVGTPHANVDIEINQPGTAAYDGPGKLNINPTTGERSVPPSAQADPNVSAYADAYMRGEGRGTSPADLQMQQFAANNAPAIEAEFQRRAAGGTNGAPTSTQPSPKDLAAALGSRSAGTGLEATAPLPKQVAGDVQRLTAHGVTPENAQAEADTKYVGARPTQGIVTRDFHLQQAEKEGAKLDTPAGLAARNVLDGNNAALHTAAQDTVAGYGGKVEPGAASEAAAASLAAASDAARAPVKALYKQSDAESAALQGATDADTATRQSAADAKAASAAQSGARAKLDAAQQAYREAKATMGANESQPRQALEQARQAFRDATDKPPAAAPVPSKASPGYIDLIPVRSALNDPVMANPTIDGGKTLRGGVIGLMDALGKGTDKFSASDAESIRQAIGNAYDVRGGSINNQVGRLKGVLDTAMDNTNGGATFKAAREAHKNWASQYENPEGVANLIKRDDQDNFANADKWRQADGSLLNSANDRQFVQVARQLKANGDTATLNKLKASVVQGAYAKASSTAADSNRNSVFSGKAFFDHLDNKVGKAKLEALFEPGELAHIATIGRAARHINEAVPGSTNGSSSGSMLLNSGLAAALRGLDKVEPSKGMSRAIGGAKLLAVGLGYHSGGVGGAMAGKMAGDATTALQTSLAKVAASKAARRADAAVTETINPALARAMSAQRTTKATSTSYNNALARGVAGRVAPAASNDDEVKTRTWALAKALRG